MLQYFLQVHQRSKLNYSTNLSRHIRKNKLSSLAPIFAQLCKFDNPLGHKAHGKRAFGMTLLSNSSVAEDT